MEDLKSLITRAQAGEPSAYGTIVQRFQDMAVGYAYSILGDFHLAEDAAQEAFIEAYSCLSKLREPKAFTSWFRKIIFKHCDRLTRRMRVETVPLEAAVEISSTEKGPAETILEQELRDNVLATIRALPEKERVATTLFYINGYSYKEIAEFLEVPVTTVDNRLRASRKRLKERMITMAKETISEKRPSRDEKFVNEVLDVIAPSKEKHSEEIYNILDLWRSSNSESWRKGRLAESHFDWKTSRVTCINDQIVQVFGVYNITMRIGKARVRVAGQNFDVTHPEHADNWPQLEAEAARESFKAMRENGYDLSVSMTGGTQDFWYNLGYVLGWRVSMGYVNPEELPSDPLDFKLHEFEPVYRQDLAELFNHENETLTGTAVKPTYLRNKVPGGYRGWYWTDSAGMPVGYVEASGGKLTPREMKLLPAKFEKNLSDSQLTDEMREWFSENFVEWTNQPHAHIIPQGQAYWVVDDYWRTYIILRENEQLCVRVLGRFTYRNVFSVDEVAGEPEQILRVLGTLVRQAGCDTLEFDKLHYRSRLGRRLRQMRSCRICNDTRTFVVRIINLKSLFERLAPELFGRLQNSHFADWQGDLTISNGEEEITLSMDRQGVRVADGGKSEHAIRGGMEIAQLVVGTETPGEVVEMNGIQLSGDAEKLIHVLFPAQYPQMENQAL